MGWRFFASMNTTKRTCHLLFWTRHPNLEWEECHILPFNPSFALCARSSIHIFWMRTRIKAELECHSVSATSTPPDCWLLQSPWDLRGLWPPGFILAIKYRSMNSDDDSYQELRLLEKHFDILAAEGNTLSAKQTKPLNVLCLWEAANILWTVRQSDNLAPACPPPPPLLISSHMRARWWIGYTLWMHADTSYSSEDWLA